MMKRISAVDLRQRLGQVMNEVSLRNDEYVVERDGRPLVVMMSLWKFEQMERQRERFFAKLDQFRARSHGVSAKELDVAIAEAIRKTRTAQRQKKTA